jgi:hypothetical protein
LIADTNCMATNEIYFTEAPDHNELLGYMAGGLRDCMDTCGDDSLELQVTELFRLFGGEMGFRAKRTREEALELAESMVSVLDAIASCESAHSSTRIMALTNAEAFRQGKALIEAELV